MAGRTRSHETMRRRDSASELLRRLRKATASGSLASLERDLLAAIDRDEVTAEPDGFPIRAERPGVVPAPAADGDEPVALTGVEGAAAARIRGRVDDPVHTSTTRAEMLVRQCVQSLEQAVAALAAIEGAQRAAQAEPDPCECHKRAGLVVPGEQFGTVGGRLDRSWWLCQACYLFVYRGVGRNGDPGAVDRVPTVGELQHHARTGRWRTRLTR